MVRILVIQFESPKIQYQSSFNTDVFFTLPKTFKLWSEITALQDWKFIRFYKIYAVYLSVCSRLTTVKSVYVLLNVRQTGYV